MKAEHKKLGLPAGSGFELFGVDFLIDENYAPWLLEVGDQIRPSLLKHIHPHRKIVQDIFCLDLRFSRTVQYTRELHT